MATENEIARRTAVARAAINQAAEAGRSSIALFASHHLQELPAAYWRKHTGTPRPDQERVLELLELRSHWGGDGQDGIEVFDFTLPGKVTQYVVSVRFNDNGKVTNVSVES